MKMKRVTIAVLLWTVFLSLVVAAHLNALPAHAQQANGYDHLTVLTGQVAAYRHVVEEDDAIILAAYRLSPHTSNQHGAAGSLAYVTLDGSPTVYETPGRVGWGIVAFYYVDGTAIWNEMMTVCLRVNPALSFPAQRSCEPVAWTPSADVAATGPLLERWGISTLTAIESDAQRAGTTLNLVDGQTLATEGISMIRTASPGVLSRLSSLTSATQSEQLFFDPVFRANVPKESAALSRSQMSPVIAEDIAAVGEPFGVPSTASMIIVMLIIIACAMMISWRIANDVRPALLCAGLVVILGYYMHAWPAAMAAAPTVLMFLVAAVKIWNDHVRTTD